MAQIKLTKNELRHQQMYLMQLQKYLPTLQLKKAMLQAEVQEVRQRICKLKDDLEHQQKEVSIFSPLLASKAIIDPTKATKIKQVHRHYENVAGVEVPYFENVEFEEFHYHLFETPPWVDGAVTELRALVKLQEEGKILNERRQALEKELREVSIRVNLFEKILIPRATENIWKLKIFLGDQQLAAVSRAKVSKNKIESSKKKKHISLTGKE